MKNARPHVIVFSIFLGLFGWIWIDPSFDRGMFGKEFSAVLLAIIFVVYIATAFAIALTAWLAKREWMFGIAYVLAVILLPFELWLLVQFKYWGVYDVLNRVEVCRGDHIEGVCHPETDSDPK